MFKKLVRNRSGKSENKKVRNARIVEVDGITFRSDLEAKCFKRLSEEGLKPRYEEERFILFDGFRLSDSLNLWLPKYKNKRIIGFERNTSKIQSITYKPDFILDYNGWKVIIETKGNPNDAYPIRRKLFFRLLQNMVDNGEKVIFFEPHNLEQIDETIEVIKSL